MSLPFFSLPTLDIGIPLQPFGIIVATGVLIGAEVLRRYGWRHGIDDDDIRSLQMWVIVTGFIGAHVLDILMYEQDRLEKALNEAHVDYTIETYENARHGFAVTGHLVYDRDASERHWQKLVQLFKNNL